MSVKEHEWQCPTCGGRKQLFFVRKPLALLFSIATLAIVFAAKGYISNVGWQLGFTYIGGLIALTPSIILLKIRCLHCEPHWLVKGVWGGSKQ